MMAVENGPGWWSFQIRKGYKAVLDLPSSQKGFRREFAFVFFGGDWEDLNVRPAVEPHFKMKYRVLELSEDEVVAACYMQMESKLFQGGEVYVV